MNESVKENETAGTRSQRVRTVRRVLLISAAAVGLLVAGVLIISEIILHRARPMLKARVVETLSNRFDCRVELDQFQVSAIEGFQVSGAGLRLYPRHLDGAEPLFRVKQFSFHVLDWRQLFRTPIYVNRVQVTGLDIRLPPKAVRAEAMPRVHSAGKNGDIKVVVGEILVRQASLVIENGKPGKVPLHFVIGRVDLRSVGAGRPLQFRAQLINPKPIGNIDSTGEFGPFNEVSPGDTPVSGHYTFRHADLNTIKGIGGILSSDGDYRGQLDNIVVDGQTQTPDFSLDTANHAMPLNTRFHAIVDGTDGDTYLQPVDAWLMHTHIVARGKVVRRPEAKGREILLDVTVQPGKIQELLQLAVKTKPPLLNGGVVLHTKFDLPPGDQSVTQKLRLGGSFALDDIHFTNMKIQGKVDELSLRGQGKPKEAKQENHAVQNHGDAGGLADIGSEMRGNFTFSGGRLNVSTLNYRVPGAKIALSGVYSLDGQQFDFHGTARLDAHVSQMVTGWKSWLLKPVDPFFAKNGAGTQVPVKITGTRSEPQVGLDFHH